VGETKKNRDPGYQSEISRDNTSQKERQEVAQRLMDQRDVCLCVRLRVLRAQGHRLRVVCQEKNIPKGMEKYFYKMTCLASHGTVRHRRLG